MKITMEGNILQLAALIVATLSLIVALFGPKVVRRVFGKTVSIIGWILILGFAIIGGLIITFTCVYVYEKINETGLRPIWVFIFCCLTDIVVVNQVNWLYNYFDDDDDIPDTFLNISRAFIVTNFAFSMITLTIISLVALF